ncbi:NTP-transferase domain-containing protein [Mycena kentingensis (nom. inval.)]|nr:NTP-transferase domain-containing protein [Mycena kentingensis (nom. inval.)]
MSTEDSTLLEQILAAVQQNSLDLASVRQECERLRQANASLQSHLNILPHAPASRPSTPFLNAELPQARTYHRPSLTGGAEAPQETEHAREIRGFYVVIPAGGAGSRLWPLSREDHPKFLLDLTLKGRSLIQATWDRLLPLASASRTTNLFCEPAARDSMAAIGLAAAILAKRDPDAIMGSFAADHMISGDEAFLAAVAEAVEVARHNDYLVTIGIAPSQPSTGFGYICLGEKLDLVDAPNARLVSSFKEKPDARTAARYIATGTYRWNAGMFVTRATFSLELLKEYQPELHRGLVEVAEIWDDEDLGKRKEVLDGIWEGLKKIPIDKAVAEPAAAAGRVAVVPATFGWDDVGNFSSLAELLPAELHQPRVLGDHGLVLTEQVAGGIIVPQSGRRICALGVDDLVIIDMPDTLFVTTRARAQEVKRIVQKAREAGLGHLL